MAGGRGWLGPDGAAPTTRADRPDSAVPASLCGAPPPTTDAELDEALSRPTEVAVRALGATDGDLLVLGAGGKMGLGLARMARRCFDLVGPRHRRVIAVSRFGGAGSRDPFHQGGVETIAADLLLDGALDDLPDAPNVLYLAGMKFGASSDQPLTWAMNAFLPGLVARRYRGSRIVALSTANVYGFVPTHGRGAVESDLPGPVGEYAESCLGRERILAYHAAANGTPTALIRLSYANALRYGVVVDIARSVLAGEPIDLAMGHASVIWQGDANAAILAAFGACASPAATFNLSGAETMSVRQTAERLAVLLDRPTPTFHGTEAPTALLIDSSRAHASFGPPEVPLDQLVEWTAAWLRGGGSLLDKPTHFQARDGRF